MGTADYLRKETSNGQVPRLLKDKVKEILEDSGMADLVKEDEEKA